MTESSPPGIGLAVLSALLFGLATPAAHQLLAGASPLMLSALLYLGSGAGLALLALPAWRGGGLPALARSEWLPLAGAVALGGVVAPVCLLAGLAQVGATRASLLLNLEGVFTALLAWKLFGEAADRGVMAGMVCVVVACLLLAWPEGSPAAGGTSALVQPGTWLVALACLCWGLDNNLTRRVSHLDARGIAMCKGLVAGSVNLLFAILHGDSAPTLAVALPALLTGLLGYGLSLVAYVRAQSLLGAARTAGWFGLAPFAGALAAQLLLHEAAPRFVWPAGGLLALGLYLHLRERHTHWHAHEPDWHSHRHRHDAHHRHDHDFAWDGREPHAHPHLHAPLQHRHAHFPDLHHRHGHRPQIGRQAALVAAYRATRYRVDADPPFTLIVDQYSAELRALLHAHACDCAAFLSACNPRSVPLDARTNEARQDALRQELEAAGHVVVNGSGEPATPGWTAEPSLLVPGLTREDALAAARRWEQNAIVWSDADAVPRLVLAGTAR